MNIDNLHLIKVKYIGATNTRGSRIKLIDQRFKNSKYLSYNYAFNSAVDIALDYLITNGYNVIGKSELLDDSNMIVLAAVDNQFKQLA